ncbi:hypothetical protein C0J52_22139 [Blattella germanica]|nr:hypothetical protein C0J52_22139 [Blattella germanica]
MTDAVSLQKEQATWDKIIAVEFNANSENNQNRRCFSKREEEMLGRNMYIFNASRQTENRTTKQLKELYFVLKRNARKHNNEDKMGHFQTGGGQFTPKSDNIDLKIVEH